MKAESFIYPSCHHADSRDDDIKICSDSLLLLYVHNMASKMTSLSKLVLLVCLFLSLALCTVAQDEGSVSPDPAARVAIDSPKSAGGDSPQSAEGVSAEVASVDSILQLDDGVDPDFKNAFLASISMILVSELGDKTFFIAAIMAMRHSRFTVFFAAIAALALMTVLSAAMGYALPSLLPRTYTHYAATVLFLVFGIRLLFDAYHMDPEEENEELIEVETELKEAEGGEEEEDIELAGQPINAETRKAPKAQVDGIVNTLVSRIFIQAFTMTFLAEWGDRSQIATIALAADMNPYGVTLGGVIGHSCCTGLAVMGGKLLATRISERMVATVGGVLFLFFAAHAMYFGEEA